MSKQRKKNTPSRDDAIARTKAKPAQFAEMSSPKLQAGSDSRWTVLGVCIFLAAITWLVFSQTLGHEFVNYDDNLYVADNPVVLNGLSLKGIVWAFTHTVNVNWTPVAMLSHMLDCQLYGTKAGWHHLTSVLLHTMSVIALFLVLKEMTSALWRSAFVAAVFAVHPLHVESVAWIAERRDVLSGVFFMLTIGAYVRYARHPWSPARYGLVVFLFALGLMSKPMLVTLPFVLLLLDYWPLKRFNQPDSRSVPCRLIVEKLPLLALSGAACVVTLFAQKEAITSPPLPVSIGNALVSYVSYLKQMFWPSGLAVLYPFPANGRPLWEVILALILLLSMTAGVFILRKTRPYLLVGWLWYLLMLVPVIGFIQSGLRAQADRYTYLPQIGLYVLLTWMAADLCASWRHRRALLGGLSIIILTALIVCAHMQVSYWKNSESLWTRTLAVTTDNYIAHNDFGGALVQAGRLDEAIVQYQKALEIYPDSAEAHNNLGSALFQKGRVDEAIAQYQKALQINPDHAQAHYNLGIALMQKGRVDEAIAQYQKALQINPDFADAHNNLGSALMQKGRVDEAIVQYQKALETDPDSAQTHNNLGNALFQKGRVDEAIVHFQQALEINPDFADAHNNLGNALLQKGRVDEAIVHYQKALQIKPDSAQTHNNLGDALLQKGKVDEAIVHYQKALEIKPDYPAAKNNLAWVLATAPQTSLRDGSRAVELAQQADQLAGGENPMILRTLAAAYAETGRFDDAVRSAKRAMELARAAGRSDIVEWLNGELKLYEAGLPFHQESK
jgi:tetratricopeptide (TPR) repeat protein